MVNVTVPSRLHANVGGTAPVELHGQRSI